MTARSFDKKAMLKSQGTEFRTAGDELSFDCPFCTDTRKRFYLNQDSGLGYCQNCEWSGTLPYFICKFLGVSFSEAEAMVDDDKSYIRAVSKTESDAAVEIEFPEGFTHFTRTGQSLFAKPYWNYVTKTRGIPASVALDFKLGYVRSGTYGGRVIIPVYWFGRLVSWQARDITGLPKGKKVLSPHGNKQSNYLLNLDRLWGREEVALVEGPFDMLTLPDIAVASFGPATVSATAVAPERAPPPACHLPSLRNDREHILFEGGI